MTLMAEKFIVKGGILGWLQIWFVI